MSQYSKINAVMLHITAVMMILRCTVVSVKTSTLTSVVANPLVASESADRRLSGGIMLRRSIRCAFIISMLWIPANCHSVTRTRLGVEGSQPLLCLDDLQLDPKLLFFFF